MDPNKSIGDVVKEVIVAAALFVATEIAPTDIKNAAELQDAQEMYRQERQASFYYEDEEQFVNP